MGSPDFGWGKARPARSERVRAVAVYRPRSGRVSGVRRLSRRRRRFTGEVLAAFGGISAVVQFTGQLFPKSLVHPDFLTLLALGGCLAWGLVRARRGTRVVRVFRQPGTTVLVAPGDLFDQPTQRVIGFSDTFDTVVGGTGLIDAASLQGQLLEREYGGNAASLDRELASELRAVRPRTRERRSAKPFGKLMRYPVGTTVVLGGRPRLVYAVACSRIGNDGVARSSVEDLGTSLHRLWDAVQLHGRLEPVAMPLLGAGLSRLDKVDVESLVRMILFSFLLRSREQLISRELRIVLRPRDFARLDLRELEALLETLEPSPAGP